MTEATDTALTSEAAPRAMSDDATTTDPTTAAATTPAASAPATDAPALSALDIFLPAPPEDEAAQEAFLDEAAQLALDGYPIRVYLQDEDAWAFEECEPVRGLVEAAGPSALPVTLLGLDIVVTAVYPTLEQMKRFAAIDQKPARKSAAASACGPGGGAPAVPRTAGGFAAQLMGAPSAGLMSAGSLQRTEEAPAIGQRRNLLGGDVGDGLPGAGESAATVAGARIAQKPADSSTAASGSSCCRADEPTAEPAAEPAIVSSCCGGGSCGCSH